MDSAILPFPLSNRLAEVVGYKGQEIKSVYWGTAPTGEPHLGYLVPLLKIADFCDSDLEVTILIADLHALLERNDDHDKRDDSDVISSRSAFYEYLLENILLCLQVKNTNKVKFIRGSSFQLHPNYTLDALRLATKLSFKDAQRGGSEMVKNSTDPSLASLIYPGMQALDEVYLNVDAQLGGIDQRKIFMLAEEFLPKIGYKPVVHMMNYMLPSINAGKPKTRNKTEIQNKMSASDKNSKIGFLDSEEELKKKIKQAFCEDRNVEWNPLLLYYERICVPLAERLDWEHESSDSVKEKFSTGEIQAQNLKDKVSEILGKFISLTRNHLGNDEYAKLYDKCQY